jgi:hypothetical protein
MDNSPAKTQADNLPAVMEGNLFFNVAKFEHAQRVAQVFASSTMVPDQFRGNVGNCIIALNLADRYQADPFMVMQNMHIIHGKPGIEAKLVISLVNNCGRFEPLDFEEAGDLKNPTNGSDGCIAFAKDIKSGKVLNGPRIDWDMVKGEGWYSKNGSKWKHGLAPLMFRYRAATYFARIYCPEVLLGMQTREELQDVVTMTPVSVAPADDKAPELEHRELGDGVVWTPGEDDKVIPGIADEHVAEQFSEDDVEGDTPNGRGQTVVGGSAHTGTEPPAPAWECEQCGFVAKSEMGLKRHINRQHPPDETPDDDPDGGAEAPTPVTFPEGTTADDVYPGSLNDQRELDPLSQLIVDLGLQDKRAEVYDHMDFIAAARPELGGRDGVVLWAQNKKEAYHQSFDAWLNGQGLGEKAEPKPEEPPSLPEVATAQRDVARAKTISAKFYESALKNLQQQDIVVHSKISDFTAEECWAILAEVEQLKEMDRLYGD